MATVVMLTVMVAIDHDGSDSVGISDSIKLAR